MPSIHVPLLLGLRRGGLGSTGRLAHRGTSVGPGATRSLYLPVIPRLCPWRLTGSCRERQKDGGGRPWCPLAAPTWPCWVVGLGLGYLVNLGIDCSVVWFCRSMMMMFIVVYGIFFFFPIPRPRPRLLSFSFSSSSSHSHSHSHSPLSFSR